MEEEAGADMPDENLDRIEAALDRIAAAHQSRSPATGVQDSNIIAERLDGLIARLRDALAIAGG